MTPEEAQYQVYLETIKAAEFKARGAIRHLMEAGKISKEDGVSRVMDAIRLLGTAQDYLEKIK